MPIAAALSPTGLYPISVAEISPVLTAMAINNETLLIASLGSAYVVVKLGFMAFNKWSGRDKRYRLEGQYDGTSTGKRG